jgi:hypothetical protein
MGAAKRLIGGTNAEYLTRNQVAGGEDPSPRKPASPATSNREGDFAMAYGLSTRAFINDGPVEHVSEASSSQSTGRPWQALSAACRFEIIEQALRAANDRIDGFPLAL